VLLLKFPRFFPRSTPSFANIHVLCNNVSYKVLYAILYFRVAVSTVNGLMAVKTTPPPDLMPDRAGEPLPHLTMPVGQERFPHRMITIVVRHVNKPFTPVGGQVKRLRIFCVCFLITPITPAGGQVNWGAVSTVNRLTEFPLFFNRKNTAPHVNIPILCNNNTYTVLNAIFRGTPGVITFVKI